MSSDDFDRVFEHIKILIEQRRTDLHRKITARDAALVGDDNAHHLLYRLLGVDAAQAMLIDRHQNTGRLLWRQLGTLIEEAVGCCFRARFPDAGPHRVAVEGTSPRTYQIDLLVEGDAYEIKWRDATTDGDHVNKERARISQIARQGLRPIGLTFFLPHREQARAIQLRRAALYAELGGVHYVEQAAWRHVHERTGIDLHGILLRLAGEQV